MTAQTAYISDMYVEKTRMKAVGVRMGRALWTALTVLFVAVRCSAVDHKVGDSAGWTNTNDYATWASQATFNVGDTLTFEYDSSSHDVYELSKGDYESCSMSNPIKKYTSGKDVITLNSAGDRYFACSFPGHCANGMKLHVNVKSSSSSSSPSSPSSSSSSSPPPPSSTPASASSGLSASPIQSLGVVFGVAIFVLTVGISV